MQNPVSIQSGCRFPIVLDSPHSGTHYPADFNYEVPLALLRQAEDTHVEKLFAFSLSSGYPMVAANFPRSYIDANRGANEIDPELFIGDQFVGIEVSPKAKLGKGLIWRMLDDGTPIYSFRLSETAFLHRLERFWQPYHAAVKEVLDDAHRSHGFFVHINCHSMPSRSAKYGTDFPGLQHPDVVLGDRDGSTTDPRITQFLQAQFVKAGYDCWVNKPYKGVELIRAYSCPKENKHAIQLEVNRKLYMDEQSLELHSGFGKLQSDLQSIMAELETYCKKEFLGNQH
jgi:N-formylglutamate deformylase